MKCTMCNHDWCWICGLPKNHWLHRIPFKPFQCIKAPDSQQNLILVILFFIMVLIFLPFILMIYLVCQAFYYGIYPVLSIADRQNKCNNSCCAMFLCPVFLFYLPIVFGAAVLVAVVGTVVFIVPAYYVHIFAFTRIIKWWQENRIDEKIPE